MSNDEETDTASETEENTLPELLTSFYDPCSVNYPTEKIIEIGKNKYNNYQKHNNEIHYKNLEKITTDQSLSTKWMYYRAGRVTSSNAKKGYTMDVNNPAVSTVNSIMQYNKAFTTKEMEYGKKSESKAFENFYYSSIQTLIWKTLAFTLTKNTFIWVQVLMESHPVTVTVKEF